MASTGDAFSTASNMPRTWSVVWLVASQRATQSVCRLVGQAAAIATHPPAGLLQHVIHIVVCLVPTHERVQCALVQHSIKEGCRVLRHVPAEHKILVGTHAAPLLRKPCCVLLPAPRWALAENCRCKRLWTSGAHLTSATSYCSMGRPCRGCSSDVIAPAGSWQCSEPD